MKDDLTTEELHAWLERAQDQKFENDLAEVAFFAWLEKETAEGRIDSAKDERVWREKMSKFVG